MIDTLALAVVLSTNSGGICKQFVAAQPIVSEPLIAFRGVGPKRLAVSVGDTLLSYGFGGATLSSRFRLSMIEPKAPRKVFAKAKVSDLPTSLLSQPMLPSTASSVLEGSKPLSGAVDPVHSKSDTKVDVDSERLPYSFGPSRRMPDSGSAILPSLPPAQSVSLTQTAANKFVEPPAPTAMDKRVSVALSATPLETVVGILSKQTGINIVLISKPDQKVTLNVKDMPLGEAVHHLAALAGVKVLKVKNTLVMADDAVLKLAYPAEYAAEGAPTPVAASTPPSAGTTVPTPPVEPPNKGEDVIKLITLKHLGATAITMALKDAVAKMGVSLTAMPNSLVPKLGASTSASTTSTTTTTDQTADNSRTILISGPAKAVSQIEAIIAQTDVARRQVAITVTIHDVSDAALNEQGIQWVPGQFNVTEASNLSPNLGTFQRSGVSFTATMKALEQADKARLLSSPNVNVMDGESSSILIGEKRQFPIVTSFNANGQPIFSIQESRIGITLDVSAQITSDGSITLAVRPEVSSIIEFLNVNGGTYPQIATRSSDSKLTMKDGDTMVIGGLVKEEDIKNYQKMPLLSSIPFFGELFKSRRLEKRKSQLIISITPTIFKQ